MDERMKKADALLRLTTTGEPSGIVFPRFQKFVQSRLGGNDRRAGPSCLPSITEIDSTVKKAQQDAETELKALGIVIGLYFCTAFVS